MFQVIYNGVNLTSQVGPAWLSNIIGMHTLLYLKWITNKDLLYNTWNSAQSYVAAWIGGDLGGEWIHVYVWPSPFPVYLKLSQHC